MITVQARYRGGLVRLLGTVAIKALAILFLNWMGWITLMSDGRPAEELKETIWVALVGALIFMIVTLLSLALSFCIAAMLWVFLGGFILWLTPTVAPGFIELNAGFWLTVLSGFIILAVHFPESKKAALHHA